MSDTRRLLAVDDGLLSRFCEEVNSSGVDTSDLTVVLDWVQYKKNFRDPIEARRYVPADGSSAAGGEIAMDLRRVADCDLRSVLSRVLNDLETEGPGDRLMLEDFTRPSESIIWSFNRTYWEHLSAWESTFRAGYAAALPGGVSDGTNTDFWRDRLSAFVDVLDDLAGRDLLPAEVFVLELGVGSGEQARIWLDTFKALCTERDRDYYGRIRYLMSDYSGDVLGVASEAVAEHKEQVSLLNIDARNPLEALSFLRYKVLFVHSCNLYDNLPTDEIMRRDGKVYEVQVRAVVDASEVAGICETHGVAVNEFGPTVERLLRIGPKLFGDEKAGVLFWADVWGALRLEQQYVEVQDPSEVRLAPSVPVRLDRMLERLPGNVRMQLSTVALEGFVNTLPLLHPQGILQVQDLFVRDFGQYRSFRGPGKMDGSIVHWLNGPLFSEVAEHLGFHVHLDPFTYRDRSNTVVLTTSPKE